MIKIKDVSYKYPSDKPVASIENLNLHIKQGEFVVLCGMSGCGKTTVTRLINGLIPHFFEGELTGEVIVKEKNIKETELAEMASISGSMFQNPKSQFFNLDTTDEMAFGCENLRLPREEIQKRIEKTNEELLLNNLMDRNIFELSGGEKQQIACGSLYAANPDVYVLDEPTSNMDPGAISRLKHILINLKNQGKTIVISEHRLYFLLDLADKFIYFKDGKIEKTFTPKEMKELSNEQLFELGLRHTNLNKIKQIYNKDEYKENAITMSNIYCVRKQVEILNIKKCSIPKNSVVAIVGENGAGKSTFINVLTGSIKSKGDIFVNGEILKNKNRIKKSYMVMQDVNRQLFCSTVEDEILLGSKDNVNIEELMKHMYIDDLKERHPNSLSGGQKQRVAICSAFAAKKDIMLYDEPTSGLDYNGMKNLSSLIQERKNEHLSTMVITHDYELILSSCTHVLHLSKGEVKDFYSLNEIGIEKLQRLFIEEDGGFMEANPKREKKEGLLKKLFKYSGNYKILTILGMILSGVSALLALLPVIFIFLGVKELFDIYPNIAITSTLTNYAYLAVISAILSMLVYFIALMCTHIAAFRIARNMKYKALEHLMDLPLGYFNENGSGMIKRTISDSASRTEGYLAHNLPDMIGAYVTPLAVIVLLFTFDFRLGLICLLPIVLGAVAMSLAYGKDFKERVQEHQDSIESMNNEAVEYVRGISVVKTFGQTVFSFKKFKKSIDDYKIHVEMICRRCQKPMVLFQMFLASIPLFLIIGGVLLFNIADSPKEFMLDFLFYIFFSPTCALMLMKIMWMGQNNKVAFDAVVRVEKLLNEKPLVYKEETKKPNNFDIEIKDVKFRYPNSDKYALDNISLNINQGETIALVGASGSGKSTIAMLIARFWDTTNGSVSIGGINVKDISEEDMMNNISFVFQNTNLYKMSILDNVKEGNKNATEEEVMNALKLARCEDILAKLPNGLSTMIGTKGIYLSGGEAQRIAIARAILKNAPIILLDEATAFTDPENEHEIQLALKELAKNKTVVMIAHRLSTIKNADNIFVIENGNIIQNGLHNDLITKEGKYKEMWDEYNTTFIWNEVSE